LLPVDDQHLADIEFYLGVTQLHLGNAPRARGHYQQAVVLLQLRECTARVHSSCMLHARPHPHLARAKVTRVMRCTCTGRANLQKMALEQQIAGLTQQAEGENSASRAAGSNLLNDDAVAEATRIEELVREINGRLSEIGA